MSHSAIPFLFLFILSQEKAYPIQFSPIVNSKYSASISINILEEDFHSQSPDSLNWNEILAAIQNTSNDSILSNSLSFLADVYGPRFMGTPNYFNSAKWISSEMDKMGIKNYLESFDSNHRGWSSSYYQLSLVEPNPTPLHGVPLAYTKSSQGLKSGKLLFLDQLRDVLNIPPDQVQGKILMVGSIQETNHPPDFGQYLIFDEETLLRAKANPDPNNRLIGYHSRRSTLDLFEIREEQKKQQSRLLEYCEKMGVLGLIIPSAKSFGILHADGNSEVPSLSKIGDLKALPSFVIEKEQFGRLHRLSKLGFDPTVAFELKSDFFENPTYNVNLIAEIPGSDPDLTEEFVILSAHLDSWHAGTGAVDNASNCATMLEVLRILKVSDLRPKRSIRMILWGGEEQVFAGSKSYTQNYVGDWDKLIMGDQHSKISALLNLDNGAGKIRGIYLMGNKGIESFFASYLQPFPQSQTLTAQYVNQTDHELFDFWNVPAFQFIQDPLNYIDIIHHSNLDTFEQVPVESLQYNAELIAYLSLRIANESVAMPRKPFHSPLPSRTGNTTVQLNGYLRANNVFIIGDFNSWGLHSTPLYRTNTGWEVKLDLPKGNYFYKFYIDGDFIADPSIPQNELQMDGKGHAGLGILNIKTP